MVHVYGDDGADAKKERVLAVAVLAGREDWWQSVEDQWVVRCGGIPFHATDCESGHGSYETMHREANALKGFRRCLLHSDPKRAAQLGARGGRRRAIFNPDVLKKFSAPIDAQSLRKLLAATIIEIRGAQIDAKTGNAIAGLAAAFLRTAEVGDLETRVAALERQREKEKA